MPERDYILRLIEQAGQFLRGIAKLREDGQPDLAVQSVIEALEKLFGLSVADLASLDAEHLFLQLTTGEHPENARDKCLVFAALNYQAGLAFLDKDLHALAQPAFHLALAFTLRALSGYGRANLPPFTPDVDFLRFQLEGFELPDGTARLLEAWRGRGAAT